MRNSQIEAAWKGIAECRKCGIRDLVLFADLTEPDFKLVHLPIDELQFQPGSSLYEAGDEGRAVFTIRSGLVKLVQYLPDGTQRIVRLLRPGAVAGLEVLVGSAYEHAAIILQEVAACRIPREVVERLNHATPRLHRQLMQRWHQSVRQADEWLTELSTGSARQRLARLLLQLCADHPDRPVRVFSREDLGAMLGITMETASRTVAEFKRSGLVAEKGPNLVLCNLPALRKAALAE
ncbi:Crp/Fnr family transcriptional regulator [Azospirillum thermophilum]|uniref:Crp/Fnr family transcriptional regulator n=1 Tax=Azospirillum thermophilum TaxID=2202148 RepID=A0A2S2CKJ5_9PROT|nr:Crp/Fnr family transcriptional regulator [Azospirillum thermophilum]AWK84966.1 Crp/Fnr family transcriptional regulator [Azospirillum thermophilum]